jgi:hypothetical protein
VDNGFNIIESEISNDMGKDRNGDEYEFSISSITYEASE